MDLHVINGKGFLLAHCISQSLSTGEGLRCNDPASWNALPDSLVMRFDDENATNS